MLEKLAIGNNKFDFNIYRKVRTIIDTLPNYPFTHKMTEFNSYVHIIKTLPSSNAAFDKEVLVIKQIDIIKKDKKSIMYVYIYIFNLLQFGNSVNSYL